MEGAMAVRVTAAHTAEARTEAGQEAGEGGVAAAAAALAPGGFLGLPAPFSEEDEDDVHRCGRCQAGVHRLGGLVQQQASEGLPAGAPGGPACHHCFCAAGSGGGVASPYCHCTRACPPPRPSADSRMRRWRHVKTDLCHRGWAEGRHPAVGGGLLAVCSGLSPMAWDAGPLSSLWLKPATIGAWGPSFLEA
uniref:Uncharacterized protein n=1 Tax=Balaenoptera musculus TaxID=9771 RepID=A0A8C0I0L0_BALMU